PSVVAVTPEGSGTGRFPIRDILEYLRQDFAADIVFARLGVRQHAARGRYDDRAEAVADARQLPRRRIDAAAGLRHARQMLDRRLALEIFELNAQALLPRKLFLGIAADIAFALEHIEHARAQLRRRRQDRILARLLAVADAGEHVTQRIGHRHPSSLPARLYDAGNQALVGQIPKHDPRQAELAVICPAAAGQLAAVADSRRVSVARDLGHFQARHRPLGLVTRLIVRDR